MYQEALALEPAARSVPFRREVELPILYKGRQLNCIYKVDFVCFESVLVELKALRDLTGVEEAQLLNYLKATLLERGLLLNFGCPRLEYRRFVFPNLGKAAQDESADGR